MLLKNCKVVLATHYLVYGASQALREYLIDQRTHSLLFIAHPLNGDTQGGSYFEKIYSGNLIKKEIISARKTFGIIDYIKEITWNIKAVLQQKDRYDLFIGVDNLNAFAGILLKKTGFVKKVIYYTIDFTPVRFENRILNFIYHSLDKFCMANSDETWNVSSRIAEGREKFRGLDRTKYSMQKIVPIGIWFNRTSRVPFKSVKKHQLLFVGNLLKKQGVHHVLEAIPIILKEIEDFHFLVIGGGDYEEELKEQTRILGIEPYVTFTGWVKDRKVLDGLISDSALAIAMYEKYDKMGNLTYTYFADPTKLKDYLCAGIPILLTDVSHNAKEIEEKQCGKIIKAEKNEIAHSVIEIIRDEKTLRNYRENALEFIQEYDWVTIFRQRLNDGILQNF